MAHVLVVDDEQSIRTTLRSLLQSADHQVEIAEDADAALALMSEQDFDVVIADVVLPGLSGVELLKAIRSGSRRTQVIVITGAPTVETAAEAVRAGAFDFLSKPIGNDQLLQAVANAALLKHLDDDRLRLEEENTRYRHDLEALVEEQTRDLRRSEARFRSIFEHSRIAMALVDTDGGFLAVNRAAADTLGYSIEALLELGLKDTVHPDDLEETREAYRQLLSGERDSCRLEKRYIHRSGRMLWGEMSTSLVCGADGEPMHFITQVLDITERKRTWEAHAMLATAVEQAGETILITDADGTILYANPAFEAVTGYSVQEAVGQTPSILKSGRHDDSFYQHLWSTISAGEVWHGHMVNRRKDGALFEEEATISPVRDEAGAIANYVAVKRDVTQEKALEDRLQQAQKMEAIGRLAGGVAHDFNNILAVIMSYSNFVKDAVPDDDQVREDIEQVLQAAERAESLTSQLLAFSRRQITQMTRIHLGDVVRDLEKLLARVIGEDVDVEIRAAELLRPVTADRGQIEQVLMNLAVNARDAMPEGGRLLLEVEDLLVSDGAPPPLPELKPGLYSVITVADSGHGMDETTLSQIFEPFFTTKGQGKGTGLGLATVYALVQQHEGHLAVDSTPGEGTTFRIYIPSATGEKEPSGETEAIVISRSAAAGETILVTEDETAVREIARRILEEEGFRVLTAANAGEALLLCERHSGPIHLLVSDVIMPHMSGPELVERALQLRPEMQVLYMTGYADAATVRRIQQQEGVEILFKPFSRETFAQKIREVIARTPSDGHPAL